MTTDYERSAKIEEALTRISNMEAPSPMGVIGAYYECKRIALAALAVIPSPPTLSARLGEPGFREGVNRARALLDAKDAGWNEGVEAAISACNEVFRVQAMCGQRGTSDGASLCTLEVRSLLIPTVPPNKEGM
jgi:hypothetical protein